MHASRLVELAAIAARQFPHLARQRSGIEDWSADLFWVHSRARVIEWSHRLKACHSLRTQDKDFDAELFWEETQPVLEEVFLAEVSTRIWCAILSAIDCCRHPGEFDPVARSVFIANLEARRRALRLLLFSRRLPNTTSTRTNTLRRDCESWTDLLLARFTPRHIALHFCFERSRVRRLAQEHRKENSVRRSVERYDTELFGLRYVLATRDHLPAICGDLNREIGVGMLSCLPANSFDGCGVARPGWSMDDFNSDLLSIDILEELCGNSTEQRYDVPGGLLDRR